MSRLKLQSKDWLPGSTGVNGADALDKPMSATPTRSCLSTIPRACSAEMI